MTKIMANSSQVLVGGQRVNNTMVFQLAGVETIASEALFSNLGGQTIADLYSASGVGLEFVSAAAADDAASTGMKTMRVWGFATDNKIQYEDVIMDGVTDVVSAHVDWKTVFYAEGLTYGSGKVAAGHITIENTANTVYYLAIDLGATASRRVSIYIPPGVIASYEMMGWFTVATTAYDGITVKQYTISTETNDTKNLVKSTAISGVAALATRSIKMNGLFKVGKINQLWGLDIGTSSQDINYSVTIGMRY